MLGQHRRQAPAPGQSLRRAGRVAVPGHAALVALQRSVDEAVVLLLASQLVVAVAFAVLVHVEAHAQLVAGGVVAVVCRQQSARPLDGAEVVARPRVGLLARGCGVTVNAAEEGALRLW